MLGAARHRDPIDHEKTEKGRINKKLDHLKELAEPLAVAYGIKKAKEMGELETAFYKCKIQISSTQASKSSWSDCRGRRP